MNSEVALLRKVVFLLCALPFAYMVLFVALGRAGPDPAERVLQFCGSWALWLLLVTLSVSPLQRFTPLTGLLRCRRMLGLWCFLYASLHLLSYGTFYLEWQWQQVVEEVVERPYIAIGLVAWFALSLLALTSTTATQRRLGRQWRRLHRLVYFSGALVLVHFGWQLKGEYAELLVYLTIFVFLLLARLPLLKRYKVPASNPR